MPFSDLHSIEPFFITDLKENVTISYLAVFSANTSNILRIAYMKNSSDFVYRYAATKVIFVYCPKQV